jgi:hypothetical protein
VTFRQFAKISTGSEQRRVYLILRSLHYLLTFQTTLRHSVTSLPHRHTGNIPANTKRPPPHAPRKITLVNIFHPLTINWIDVTWRPRSAGRRCQRNVSDTKKERREKSKLLCAASFLLMTMTVCQAGTAVRYGEVQCTDKTTAAAQTECFRGCVQTFPENAGTLPLVIGGRLPGLKSLPTDRTLSY